jgi:ribosomal protein L7Ae-like RNA K-turn-binding protein
LAEDCDNDQYKETLTTLAAQTKVPVVTVEAWTDLKDFCKLGLLSSTIRQIAEEKGKEPKIKPRCSCAAIIDWGEDSEARKFLEAEFTQ